MTFTYLNDIMQTS